MKLFAFLLLAGIFCQSLAEIDSSTNDEQNAGIFIETILRNLLEISGSGCSSVRHVLNSEHKKSLHCMANNGSSRSFCDSIVNYFADCTNTLVETIESCADPRFRGIANALVTSLVAQASFMCNTDGEHLLEIFNPCVMETFIFQKRGSDAGKCISSFVGEINQISRTKDKALLSLICKALSNVKNCIKEPFESNCPNKITRNTLEEIYNTNVKVCSN